MSDRVAWTVTLTALALGLLLPVAAPAFLGATSKPVLVAFAVAVALAAAAVLGIWRLVSGGNTPADTRLRRHEQRVHARPDGRYAHLREHVRAYVDHGEGRSDVVDAFTEGLSHRHRLTPEKARALVEARIPATNGRGDPHERAEAVRLLSDDLHHRPGA